MNKNIILLVSVIVLFLSCNQNKKEAIVNITELNEIPSSPIENQPNEGYILMKNNCYVCHNPNAESHDDIIAPPFRAVKMRYSREYDSKEDFVNAIVNWVQNPQEEKALMFGAVNKFKVMPKQLLLSEDLEKIATYLYENEVEEPKWMKDHMQEGHGGKMGKGMGQMRRRRGM